MPIYNSKDLIPFVNQLEGRINEMNSSLAEWDREKFKIISAVKKVDSNYQTAMSALVKADEALAEIGTAVFTSTASRGKRLEDTLNKLRDEMYDIAAQVGEGGGGGGGSLTEGMFFDELNNAIASVDATVEDGLKLDYRLREITDMAKTGVKLSGKQLFMPYKHDVAVPVQHLFVPEEKGVTFVDGDVTALNKRGEPMLDANHKIITGTVMPSGEVTLSNVPTEPFTLYFPVKMSLGEIPDDFLYLFLEQIIQKNSRVMEVVLNFEGSIDGILQDIKDMKGVSWTPDYSIMRNHQNIVKEGITPKGLNVEVKDGMAHVTFSYNDHPHLSHFIVERWNEEQKKFLPYDGVNGIVQK